MEVATPEAEARPIVMLRGGSYIATRVLVYLVGGRRSCSWAPTLLIGNNALAAFARWEDIDES